MPTEIDILMDLDPLELTKDGPEIEAIIAYYRNNRAKEGADGKMKKPKAEGGAAPQIDLTALLDSMAKKKAPVEGPTVAQPQGAKPKSGFRRL